jgi:hypothetical protein
MTMQRLLMGLACMLMGLVACKKPEITPAPVKSIVTNNTGPVVVVTGADVIGVDQVPQLTVSINVGSCLGATKWLDPNPPTDAHVRAGAVSIAPKLVNSAESTQPESKVFEPLRPIDATDSTSRAKKQYVWRIKRASYSIELIAYSYKESDGTDTKTESTITKTFDFNGVNEVNLAAEGAWQDGNCKLAWK